MQLFCRLFKFTQHINLTGDYIWIALKDASGNHDGLRPLRTPHSAKLRDVRVLSRYAYQEASWLVPANPGRPKTTRTPLSRRAPNVAAV